MDRFRKFVEAIRVKWRDFVNRNWHNQPEGDTFRLFDVVLLVGAIRSPELPKKWHRYCWKMYRWMTVFHLLLFALNCVEHVFGKFAFDELVWHTMLFASTSICFVQQAILNRFFPTIQKACDFINGKPTDSGDKLFDAKTREKVFKRTQLVAGSLLLLSFLGELLVFVPNSGMSELLKIPRIIRTIGGPHSGTVTQLLLIALVFPLWFCKHIAATGLVCSMLYGFRTEMYIFARGFDDIWNRVQLEVEENLPPTSTATEDQPDLVKLRQMQRDKLFWKYFNQLVKDHVKMHLVLLENLQPLQNTVKWLFFAIYYYTLIITSPALYVMICKGISGITALVTPVIVGYIFECYMWCSLGESFKEINDNLEISIMNLMTKMYYSKEHHPDYTGMRKTLLIMKTNIRNSCQFSCGGVFNISIEVVTELLNISYSVFTFLRDFGKVDAH